MNYLELRVQEIANTMHDHQVARLYKIPNDIRLADGVVTHGGQTPCDFLGWTIGGRAIAIECKMFNRPSLPVGEKGLKAHQLIALTECHKAGGVGLLVWLYHEFITVIEPNQIATYSKGRKSIPWKSIPMKYKRPVVCDWDQFFWPFLVRATAPSA
jgi:penicillin-binding protein-related factor A (putative recombinase)